MEEAGENPFYVVDPDSARAAREEELQRELEEFPWRVEDWFLSLPREGAILANGKRASLMTLRAVIAVAMTYADEFLWIRERADREGKALDVNAVARLAGMDRAVAGRALRALRDAGILTQTMHGADRRTVMRLNWRWRQEDGQKTS